VVQKLAAKDSDRPPADVLLAAVNAVRFEGLDHARDGMATDAAARSFPIFDSVRVKARGLGELALRQTG
jgi:hypothetical protein